MRKSKRSRKYPAKEAAQGKKTSVLEHDLILFLGVLCVEWGFCIPTEHARRIARMDSMTSDDFAKQVLSAENMNWETSPWFKKISKRFAEQFGDEVHATRRPHSGSVSL